MVSTLQIILLFGLGGFLLVGFMAVVLFFLYMKSWKIDVIILKYMGDKRRPSLDISRKGKIITRVGVSRLKIRGLPPEFDMKNFRAEHYWSTVRGRKALVLFEFANNLMTPITPQLATFSELSPYERQDYLRTAPIVLSQKQTKTGWFAKKEATLTTAMSPVSFDFDPTLYRELLLKAVDDTDMGFIVRNISRIDTQYMAGWRDFLKTHGWIIGWLLLFILAIIGITLFFQKAPDLARACADAAVQSKNSIIERAANSVGPGA